MTEQEQAWAGEFGNAYSKRSPGNEEANYHLFRHVLRHRPIDSLLEIGAGTGANLRAIAELYPAAHLAALEINTKAIAAMKRQHNHQHLQVIQASAIDWEPVGSWDMVLTKGVLIHIPPEHLPAVYDVIHKAARNMVLLAEYYSPKPQAIPYRGQDNLLWKRDFAGELMDRHPDLYLLDAGFAYHRGQHPQDDLTWFLLEKR